MIEWDWGAAAITTAAFFALMAAGAFFAAGGWWIAPGVFILTVLAIALRWWEWHLDRVKSGPHDRGDEEDAL